MLATPLKSLKNVRKTRILELCVIRRTSTSLVTPIDFVGRRINLCKTHRILRILSYKIRQASINACIIGHRLNPPSLPVVNTRGLDFECGLYICTCIDAELYFGHHNFSLNFTQLPADRLQRNKVSLNNRARNHRCSQLKSRTTNYLQLTKGRDYPQNPLYAIWYFSLLFRLFPLRVIYINAFNESLTLLHKSKLIILIVELIECCDSF